MKVNIKQILVLNVYFLLFSDVWGKALPTTALWGTCLMMTTMNGKLFIATISKGDAGILKHSESDVSLHIPKDSARVYKKYVHADHSKIESDIPEEECIITPLVEIHHVEGPDEEQNNNDKFIIKLTHCIKERELWDLLKVRKWKRTETGMVSKELFQKKVVGCEGDYFVMDDSFITVVTQHFCLVAGTICDWAGCRSTLRIMLMGKLESRKQKNINIVKLKSFLCSRLLILKDFKHVSKVNINLIFQNAIY